MTENTDRVEDSLHLSNNRRAKNDKDGDKTEFLPLREWIRKAIEESSARFSSLPFHAKNASALLSDSYIIPALKIAQSLADQICDGQEMLKAPLPGQAVKGNYSFLPTTAYDWADRVVVQMPTSTGQHHETSVDLEPLAPSPQANETSMKPDDFDVAFNVLALNTSLYCNVENTDACDEDFKCDSTTTKFLRASKAQLFPPVRGEKKGGRVRTEQHRIHFLGRVFYEIFSGGEIPIEIQQGGHCNGLNPHNSSSLKVDFHGKSLSEHFANSNDDTFRESDERDNSIVQKQRRTVVKSQNFDLGEVNCMHVEDLKLNGLPVSLCDLIGDMLNSVCVDDLSNDESYQNVIDIRRDLQLMLDKPSKFLWNRDPKLSLRGLELNGAVYGRDEELASLRDCYHRSLSGNSAHPILTGPSGIGKTSLARHFGDYVADDGGLFLSGKFDHLQQSRPFSAIADAFDEYCNVLVGSVDSESEVAVASLLRQALGRDAIHLMKIVPNLSMIMGDTQCNSDEDCVNAPERLQYLLCRFIEIITVSTKRPLVLFLDDLQWADQTSITVITRLLLAPSSSRFLLIGSCRDDEMCENHPVWKMKDTVEQLGVNTRIIKLSHIGNDTVNAMISDLLCLFPRKTRRLADIIHHKTRGNPLFLSRLLVSLVENGLVQFNLSSRRWGWDEAKIRSFAIPDDVAKFLARSIERLSPDICDVLCTLACFGAVIHVGVIEVLEKDIGLQLQNSLESAVSEGFLDKADQVYRFSHDRIQEAAYSMLNSQDRAKRHSKYGLALCMRATVDDNNGMIFTAVEQVNRGDPQIVYSVEERSLISTSNFRAGRKAMAMSDFVLALEFFERGINFLYNDHWDEDYEFTLELFDCAAKCAYAIGDHEKLKLLSNQVLASARSFEGKLNVLCHTINLLCDASLLDKAIEKCTWLLSMLGVEFSWASSRDTTLNLVEKMRSILSGHSNEYLLQYKKMIDHSKIIAMKVLSRLKITLVVSRPDFSPVVTLQMVELSLKHGMSPMSAIGFVYLGSMLASLGHMREGSRFVKLALKIVQRFGAKELAGEVMAISTQTAAYVEPMQSSIEFHMVGHKSSQEVGDIRSASLNFLLYCGSLFWSGAHLNRVKVRYEEACRFMERHNTLSMMQTEGRWKVNKLINGYESGIDIPVVTSKHCVDDKNVYAKKYFHFQNMYISYIYRDFGKMKSAAEKFIESKFQGWTILVVPGAQAFIFGLVSFWIFRQTNDTHWLAKGTDSKDLIQKWEETSEWNFFHKRNLLEAEEHFCLKNYDKARLCYNVAISASKEHKFIHDEALACELAGHFSFEMGDMSAALEYFTRSNEMYHEWGAIAKATAVFNHVVFTFQNVNAQP